MRRYLILLSGLTGIMMCGCDGQAQHRTTSPQPVKAIQVRMSNYQNVAEIPGEVAPRFQVNLGFRTDGRMTERLVDVGSHIQRGQVLARLESDKKKADLDVASATLQSARAALVLRQNMFNRDQKLLKIHVIAQVEWDQAREDLSRAHAGVASAQASFNTAKDALTYTELKSDAEGVIISRQIETGQAVAAAQTVFTLAQDGSRDAVFMVPENIQQNNAPGDEIEVSVLPPAGEGKLSATVREVSPLPEESSGTVRLKAALPSSVQWSPGTPVTGRFLAKTQQMIFLPPGALTSVKGDPAVWVINGDKGTVSLQGVRVANYRSQDVVIAAGLEPGMWVVTQGGKFLTTGQRVVRERN